ncbi:MAG: vWA domain-containing protein, partial [Omnitrophica WOR_2 bacterium]
MNLLSPVFLLFGLLAIPILILYMLKLRRREVPVSSSLLWSMVLRDRQANAPWQRIKRNLLLFLQLLILAALVLALARPAFSAPNIATGSLVILLDASASMNATDVLPSRFEAARSIARGLIDNLGTGSRMSLILVGRQPQVLASSEQDKSELHRALDSAAPTQGSADWQAAFALAAGAADSSGDRNGQKTSTIIVSDGGLPKEGLPPLPGEVRYIPVGKSADNLAIDAMALRAAGGRVEL